MPMHNWKKVRAGIYHAFHHGWIHEIARSLNQALPKEYYALPGQTTAGFGPDVLTLQGSRPDDDDEHSQNGTMATATSVRLRPKTRFMVETDVRFFERKKSEIAIRHVSDDEIIAVVEIVSPGNKSGKKAFQKSLDKACQLLEERVHLLIIDPFPPTKRDPDGIHAAIWDWEDERNDQFQLPPDKPLTLVAYECDSVTRAYIETIAVGDPLPDMPLFLDSEEYISVPLEATYKAAFDVMPKRWKSVLESKTI